MRAGAGAGGPASGQVGAANCRGRERVRTALDSYASCSPTQWRRRISGSYDFLKDELWQCFLASGMTIDEAKGLILMMGGKR